MSEVPNHKRLYRSEKDRLIAGVAGGLAEYFSIDPLLVRIGFFLLVFANGLGILAYILCWIFIPSEFSTTVTTEEVVKENVEKISQQFRSQMFTDERRIQLGFILLFIGIGWLLVNLGLVAFHILIKLWPLLLIILGWQLLVKKRK